MSEISDYRQLYGKEHLGSWDLQGKDVTVTIASVKQGKAKSREGEAKKPLISFVGRSKTFLVNATNGAIIAKMYGPNPKNWIGKQVTLYPTVVAFGSERVDAVRVRPTPPKAGSKDSSGDFNVDPPTPEEIAAIRAAEIAEASREPGQEG